MNLPQFKKMSAIFNVMKSDVAEMHGHGQPNGPPTGSITFFFLNDVESISEIYTKINNSKFEISFY